MKTEYDIKSIRYLEASNYLQDTFLLEIDFN
jgi:hypothetical protein